jgi:adenosylcobinamide-GDP ribazoletransferase
VGALSAGDRLGPRARDIAAALRFFTRLPLSPDEGTPFDIDRIAWAAPVAGVAVGLVGSLVLAITQGLGLPALFSATLATATLVAATGALHEDGVADVADGFGGGATRARKLHIMRDSRIGAYGAVALTLALILRVGALAAALKAGFWFAAGALILVAALGLFATGIGRALAAAAASAIGGVAMTALASRAIGGQTGDVAGAAQQWAEIAAWCGLLIGQSSA